MSRSIYLSDLKTWGKAESFYVAFKPDNTQLQVFWIIKIKIAE